MISENLVYTGSHGQQQCWEVFFFVVFSIIGRYFSSRKKEYLSKNQTLAEETLTGWNIIKVNWIEFHCHHSFRLICVGIWCWFGCFKISCHHCWLSMFWFSFNHTLPLRYTHRSTHSNYVHSFIYFISNYCRTCMTITGQYTNLIIHII